jgi:hypothetical protein
MFSSPVLFCCQGMASGVHRCPRLHSAGSAEGNAAETLVLDGGNECLAVATWLL